MKQKNKEINHITMCPYCRQLFDIAVGDKFMSGEIKRRWPEKTIHYSDYDGKEIIIHPEAEEYKKQGRDILNKEIELKNGTKTNTNR